MCLLTEITPAYYRKHTESNFKVVYEPQLYSRFSGNTDRQKIPHPVPKFWRIPLPEEQSNPESRQDILRFPESCTLFGSNPASREYPSRPCTYTVHKVHIILTSKYTVAVVFYSNNSLLGRSLITFCSDFYS